MKYCLQINREREREKEKQLSHDPSESQADSSPSACSFDNDRSRVFNIAKKEARQCGDIQMRSSVNMSAHITVKWEQFVFVSAYVWAFVWMKEGEWERDVCRE